MLIKLILGSMLSAYAALWLCQHLALVDEPDDRKLHHGTIPLAGGLAIYGSFLLANLLWDVPAFTTEYLIVLSCVFILGLLDDRRHINPGLRLALHYVAGLAIATWGGIVISNVGNLLALGDIPLLALAVPLTALSFAGLANACNMIDGINGLCAGLVGLPISILLFLAHQAHHPAAMTLTATLIPLFFFMVMNLGPGNRYLPRVFLGDSGSITLGFMLTASLVFFSQTENALIRPVTALWLVSVPLMDMLAAMARRLREKRSLTEPDRYHLHYTLIDLGLSPLMTLAVILLWAGLCAAAGLALERFQPYWSLLLYFLLFLGHCAFVIQFPRGKNPRKRAADQLKLQT